MKLYLASSSPRRKELLTQLGLVFEVVVPEVDESAVDGEHPAVYVERLANEKASTATQLIDNRDPYLVIGSDTSVVVDNTLLGKPQNQEQAGQMLKSLSGRSHKVITAVSIAGERQASAVIETKVSFRPLSTDDINAYCSSGEPMGKAGAYAIQGLAAAFIERIEGSYSCVMGLPLFETAQLLSRCGFPVTKEWGVNQ